MAFEKIRQQLKLKLIPLQKHLATLAKPQKSQLVGIDIGPELIRILKMNANITPFVVEHFAVGNTPPGSYVKEELKDTLAISNTLRDLFRQSNIETKFVALAIPRSIAIIKNITVDARLNAEEIESRAWIEANRHFPDLIGDIHLDFTITGPSSQDPSQLDLLLVACRKDQIKPYLDVLKQAGLTAKIVDVNCYALERAMALVQDPQIETAALLNLNLNLSSFVVVQKGVLIHAHDQTYDGKRLVTQTQTFLKSNTMDNPAYQEILKETLISHLRHALHFFYSSRPHVTLQRIYLSGDCATVPGLPEFINKELGIETVIANPFVHVTQHQGFTFTELLVALTINTLLFSVLIGVYVANISHYNQSLNTQRLNQQLQGTLDIMASEIRRAGYWANAQNDLGLHQNNNPFMVSGSTDVSINGSNDCILFSYDHNEDGSIPSVGSGSDDERYGFRLMNGAIQTRPPGAPFNCTTAQANWENVTDTTIITISALTFTLTNSTYTTGPGTRGLLMRSLDISVTGNLTSDPAVTRTLTQHVRIRNDKFIP